MGLKEFQLYHGVNKIDTHTRIYKKRLDKLSFTPVLR